MPRTLAHVLLNPYLGVLALIVLVVLACRYEADDPARDPNRGPVRAFPATITLE